MNIREAALTEIRSPNAEGHRRYVTESQLADELRNSRRTLQRMRADGSGPLFLKVGRKVIYRWDDVEAWLDTRSVGSTAEAKERGLR